MRWIGQYVNTTYNFLLHFRKCLHRSGDVKQQYVISSVCASRLVASQTSRWPLTDESFYTPISESREADAGWK